MSISVIFARGLMAELQHRKIEPETLLRACRIDRSRVVSWREMLSAQEVALLARTAVELTADPGLGLSMGRNAPFEMLQLYGHLLLAQPTLRSAIEMLQRYSCLIGEHFGWGLTEWGTQAALSFSLAAPPGDAVRIGADYALAVAARLVGHFGPRDAALHAVHWQHSRPCYSDRYLEAFACPVEFDRQRNEVTFPRSYLDLEQHHADALLAATLRREADRLLKEERVAAGVARRLGVLLLHERDLSKLRPERVADQLGMSARGLRRRLRKEGTTFSNVVDRARCRVACDELLRDDATVGGTAQLLGFSEPSAFHRAFRRWTGRTPKQFLRSASPQ